MEGEKPAGDVPIVRRIGRQAGIPALGEVLAQRLSASDLHSLLLYATRRRSARRPLAAIVDQQHRDRSVALSTADGRLVHELEGLALAAAPGFAALVLAPVCPVGLNTVLGGIDQNSVLATVRGTEVLADSTTALALECAARRRGATAAVDLCAAGRVLRMQPFAPGWSQHFALFSLVSGGRAEAGHGFELAALRRQIEVYLRMLRELCERGVTLDEVAVEVAGDQPRLERIEEVVFAPLAMHHKDVRFTIDRTRTAAASYYRGLMLNVAVRPRGRESLSVADGGATDWAARLLSDRREQMVVSGIGLEILAQLLRR